MKDPNDWNPAEALYAFCGWLTTRAHATIMGATHDIAPTVTLLKEFCERHKLRKPRKGWEDAIVPPPPPKKGKKV